MFRFHRLTPFLASAFLLFAAALSARAQEGRPVSPDEPLAPLPAAGQTPTVDNTDKVELHRIRIINKKDGAILVSTDTGKTWRLIGRVLAPATAVAPGYVAAQYAPPGTVAATAIHGLRIRTSVAELYGRPPFVMGIEPAEYASRRAISGGLPNQGFGGYTSGAAGIFTDIPAGTSLFRELAPFCGNPVFVEGPGGRLYPIPETFAPTGNGEILVITVLAPKNPVTTITIDNKVGGAVEVAFADGTSRQVTGVVRPVLGVGRFDGTAYTGVGQINTAHTGVITVSTAPVSRNRPEGTGKEQRGGFQICPEWHNARTDEGGAPQILTLGSPGPRKRELEGTPPLFRDTIGLDPEGAKVEVSIDGGPWEPMPTIMGLRPAAFTGPGLTTIWKEQGIDRKSTRGVTGFRITLPKADPARSEAMAIVAAENQKERRLIAAKAGQVPIVNGVLTINASPTNSDDVAFVRFSVEGTPRGFTNVYPFKLTWDTTRVPDGEYLVEAEAMDAGGVVIATSRRRVYVLNATTKPQTQANKQ